MKLVSIVMAALDAESFIGDALSSVPLSLGKDFDYEILLADGGSRDSTLSIAAQVPHLRVVSHTDRGIYDGMNEGLAEARGDFVVILNSDDLLLPGALAQACHALEKTPDADFVSAPALFGASLDTAVLRDNDAPLSSAGCLFGVPVINARLYRGAFLRDVGSIGTDIGLAADREYLLRISQMGAGLKLGDAFYFYRMHQGSHTISGDEAGRRRIYEAEIAVAAHLLSRNNLSRKLRDLAAAEYALAALKLRIRHGEYGHNRKPSLMDYARALYLARKWRGRLSGY